MPDCITKLKYHLYRPVLKQLSYKSPKLLFFTFFSHSIRMSGKSLKFEDNRINKSNFHKNKKLFKTNDIDVNKILVSRKESYGKKKFT